MNQPPTRLVWTNSARRDLRRLDPQVSQRIIAAAERLAITGYGDIRPLRDRGGQWRLRVGDWRVLFMHESNAIQIMRVFHRSQAYR